MKLKEHIKNQGIIYILSKLIFSVFIAITLVLDMNLVFEGYVIQGGLDKIYMKNFEFIHVMYILLITLGIYIAITLLELLIKKFSGIWYNKNNNKRSIKAFFIILAVIVLCWLPYLLSYFPGGIYSDTIHSIQQAIGEESFSNHNPLLYALMLKVFLLNGYNVQIGMGLFTIFQFIVMACTCAYFAYWLYKKNISIKYIVLTTIFFALFKLFPLYAISIWKDLPFCVALFWYSIFLAEIVYKDAKNLEKRIGTGIYCILLFLVAFTRNNGIYIVIATTAVLFIVYRKRLLNVLKKFGIASLVAIAITMIIQGPVYNKLKLSTKFSESVGVMLQQIAYVVTVDGNVTAEELEFLNNIYPIEAIKETYNPCISDTMKWDEKGRFNHPYLDKNKSKFIKTWLKILLRNPGEYVNAYLLNTIGFWDVNKATYDSYTNELMWHTVKDKLGVEQYDLIKDITGNSIRDNIKPQKPISSAVFLVVLLLGMVITIQQKRYKNLIAFLPALLTWGTIMIAAPLAFSLRYVYILVLMVPFSIILPFIKSEEVKNNE